MICYAVGGYGDFTFTKAEEVEEAATGQFENMSALNKVFVGSRLLQFKIEQILLQQVSGIKSGLADIECGGGDRRIGDEADC